MPQNPLSPDPSLIDRYLAGEADAADVEIVERWLDEHPHERTALYTLWMGVAEPIGPVPHYDREHEVASIVERTLRSPDVRQRSSSGRSLHWPRYGWLGIGAACMAALLIVFAGTKHSAPAAAQFGRSYATSTGQRANIRLEDGTLVTLAPASTLRLDAGFGRTTRAVTLVGEGYFDVSHTTGKPFTVHTTNAVTRVLGTGFDVRQYAGDTETRVAVTRGKVELVANTGQPVALTAGLVGFANDSAIARTEHADTVRYTGWRNGQLIFRDAPASDVAATVSRWYDVDVRLSDSTLRHIRLNATLEFKSVHNAVLELEMLLHATATYASSPGGRPVITFRARTTDRGPERRTRPHMIDTPTEVGR